MEAGRFKQWLWRRERIKVLLKRRFGTVRARVSRALREPRRPPRPCLVSSMNISWVFSWPRAASQPLLGISVVFGNPQTHPRQANARSLKLSRCLWSAGVPWETFGGDGEICWASPEAFFHRGPGRLTDLFALLTLRTGWGHSQTASTSVQGPENRGG